jgi:DNA-nicking Smr family endonuclease
MKERTLFAKIVKWFRIGKKKQGIGDDSTVTLTDLSDASGTDQNRTHDNPKALHQKQEKSKEQNLQGTAKEPLSTFHETILPIEAPAGKTTASNKPSDPVAKKRRRKSPNDQRFDSKGFRIITEKHNLHQLFGGEPEKEKDYDFASMFEESQGDVYQQRLLKDKTVPITLTKRNVRTPTEQIKTFPPPQKELDLHGFTAIAAEAAVGTFIENSRRNGLRTIRLIVGKGLHSHGKAVLPDVVEQKVFQLKRDSKVLAMNWEKKDKRKSGALIVYLIPIP